MRPPLLVLLDIDGTLVWRASAEHAQAVMAAAVERFGPVRLDPAAGPPPAGRTDRAIVRGMLRAAGVSDAQIDAGMDDLLAAAAARYAPGDLRHTVLPGIPELLLALAGEPAMRLGLVTGNIEAVAHRKLTAAGIDAPLRPWLGAYGSDHEDRNALVPIAQRRAAGHHGIGAGAWPAEATVIVGDTPHDIACARAAGAHVIAVTTGAFAREDLTAADAIADSASELAAALRALAG